MAETHKISVALTDEELAVLEAAVDAGDYVTKSEIIREAIRDWRLKRHLPLDEVEHLRSLWDQGKASGPARRYETDRIIGSAKARAKGSVAR